MCFRNSIELPHSSWIFFFLPAFASLAFSARRKTSHTLGTLAVSSKIQENILKKIKIIYLPIIIISFIVFIHLITYLIDLNRIQKNKPPLLSIPIIYVKDGGTVIYFGFGYQVIYWHFSISKNEDNTEIMGYNVGYEIHNLFNLKYIPFNNYKLEPDKKTVLFFVTE